MRHLRPEVVFHAAAYKHVPILETTPLPGISANVIGTAQVLAACESAGVPNFVFVSSDKAVAPANVLGLTKRFGELLTMAYAHAHRRTYAVVRFGNVLASAGSVVPTFDRQLDAGGPLTITHPETSRYFMTIREAAGLVIEAGAIADAGDLLVLDMGRPVPIVELARKMIRLRGLRHSDIEIRFIGLRPGEKLHEQLYGATEVPSSTSHPRVMRVAAAKRPTVSLPMLLTVLSRIEERSAALDADGALSLLRAVVTESEPGLATPSTTEQRIP